MRPVIGISSGFEVSGDAESPTSRLYLAADYAEAVLAAGGLPQPLPVPSAFDAGFLDSLVGRLDGLLLSGGPDIDPKRYGQAAHPATKPMHPRRLDFEIALLGRAEAVRLPTLAICLGFQLLHVARGGRLIQHLPDVPGSPPLRHNNDDSGASAYHQVTIDPSSRLAEVVGGTKIEVNSRHHQGVDGSHAGRGLRPVAHAPDGLLEASEDCDGRFLIGVQWHPENLFARPEQLQLFEALVLAAGRG